MNIDSSNPTARSGARARGVALIMVAVLLTVIFVLAIAFVSASRMDRSAGRAHSSGDTANAAVGALAKQIGQVLATGRINELLGNQLEYTYPDDTHFWLSTLDGRDDDRTDPNDGKCNGPWSVWPHLTLLSQGASYVNASTLEPLIGVGQTLPFGIEVNDSTTWQGETMDTCADAGGSGIADARWIRVSLPGPDGIVWIAAVRIIDNGSMVNLNTATQATWSYYDYRHIGVSGPTIYNRLFLPGVTGATPADIDLFGMLVNIPWDQTNDGMYYNFPGPWSYPGNVMGGAFANRWPYYNQRDDTYTYTDPNSGQQSQQINRDPLTGRPLTVNDTVNASGFLYSMHVGPLDSTTPDGRKEIWQKVGSHLPALLNVAPDPNMPSSPSEAAPFGFMDEAELRMRFGANNSQVRLSGSFEVVSDVRTALKWATGDGLGSNTPIRGSGLPFLYARQMPYDYRHLVTCYNGEAQTRNSGGTYRGYMPYWIKQVTGWEARLDPNNDSSADLAKLFDALLSQPATLATLSSKGKGIYMGSPAEATRAAYSLAANLVAYRNNSNDVNASAVGDYYGLEPQPFFVEATTIYVHPDDAGTGTTGPGKPLLLIELRNPFPVGSPAINLSQYTMSVDGGAGTFALPNFNLLPGKMVVLYSTGDVELLAYLDKIGVLADRRAAISQSSFPPSPDFRLYANNGVMVDRMRYVKLVASGPSAGTLIPAAPSAWAATDLGAQTVSIAGYRKITSASIWRDARNSGNSNSGSPCYVMEGFRVADANPTSGKGAGVDLSARATPIEVPSGAYVDTTKTGSPFGSYLSGIQGSVGFGKGAGPALPPVFVLPYKNAPLDAVGEILTLPTVAHSRTRPFSEGMTERYFLTVNPGGAASIVGQSYGGALWTTLDWTHYTRLAPTNLSPAKAGPSLPVVMTLFDGLDIIGPQVNLPIISGRININTAPPKVIARLPWMHRYPMLWAGAYPDSNNIAHYDFMFSDGGFYGSDIMVAYRDKAELPRPFENRYWPPLPPAASMPPGSLPQTGTGHYKDRALCNISGISQTPGFTSAGEPLAVRRLTQGVTQINDSLDYWGGVTKAGVVNWTLDRYGINGVTEKPAGPDPWQQWNPSPDTSPNDTVDDAKELSLLFNKMSNLVTIRSDVFTASVLLQGRRYNPQTQKYDTLVTRRFVAGFDRSCVTPTNPSPKVLYLVLDGGTQVVKLQSAVGSGGDGIIIP